MAFVFGSCFYGQMSATPFTHQVLASEGLETWYPEVELGSSLPSWLSFHILADILSASQFCLTVAQCLVPPVCFAEMDLVSDIEY